MTRQVITLCVVHAFWQMDLYSCSNFNIWTRNVTIMYKRVSTVNDFFFSGLFRTVRIKVSEVFTLTCLVSTVIALKLLNLICKWISDPKWNCHLYTISALFHCRTGFASAAASPSESANKQLPEKESASKIKTARWSRISTSSPPACVFSCHYLVPVTRVSCFSARQHPRGSKQHM